MLCYCHVFACLYTMSFFVAYQARWVFGFGLPSLGLVLLDCFIFRLSNNGLQTVDLVLGPSLWIFCRRVFELCLFHPSLHLLFTPNYIFWIILPWNQCSGGCLHLFPQLVDPFWTHHVLFWPDTSISCKLSHFPAHIALYLSLFVTGTPNTGSGLTNVEALSALLLLTTCAAGTSVVCAAHQVW